MDKLTMKQKQKRIKSLSLVLFAYEKQLSEFKRSDLENMNRLGISLRNRMAFIEECCGFKVEKLNSATIKKVLSDDFTETAIKMIINYVELVNTHKHIISSIRSTTKKLIEAKTYQHYV